MSFRLGGGRSALSGIGTEAVMVGLLLANGIPQGDAIAATLVIRLATLWFAVAIGALALSRMGSKVEA